MTFLALASTFLIHCTATGLKIKTLFFAKSWAICAKLYGGAWGSSADLQQIWTEQKSWAEIGSIIRCYQLKWMPLTTAGRYSGKKACWVLRKQKKNIKTEAVICAAMMVQCRRRWTGQWLPSSKLWLIKEFWEVKQTVHKKIYLISLPKSQIRKKI